MVPWHTSWPAKFQGWEAVGSSLPAMCQCLVDSGRASILSHLSTKLQSLANNALWICSLQPKNKGSRSGASTDKLVIGPGQCSASRSKCCVSHRLSIFSTQAVLWNQFYLLNSWSGNLRHLIYVVGLEWNGIRSGASDDEWNTAHLYTFWYVLIISYISLFFVHQ